MLYSHQIYAEYLIIARKHRATNHFDSTSPAVGKLVVVEIPHHANNPNLTRFMAEQTLILYSATGLAALDLLRRPLHCCSSAKTNLARNHKLLRRGLKRLLPARDPKYVTTYTMETDARDYIPR